ncbi:polyamine ABC transporter substrate-binding protein [Haloarchaeobius amylolyticus]|uniref:polyamine ABC transporter substrate-binding protein n=1 Tax=Haloarchaeobius amylolyticus TaxID=1198296 RepID=UPI00226DC6C9|nr:spermidine/putrescine ABC transporter substrate-binding protein [Haloarchaeobius amylolyticus]
MGGRSRRAVLGALAATSSGVAAGCFGAGDRRRPPTTTDTSERGNPVLRDRLGLSLPEYDIEDELRIFQWHDYWPRETIRHFADAFGVDVTVDYYNSNETMYRALQDPTAPSYDLVFPSGYYVTLLVDEERIAPLDRSKLTNWSNLAPRWRTQPTYDPGPGRHSVPFQWGTSGIAWNRDRTDIPLPVSWDVLWDDAYAGQVTMLNDVRESVGVALKRLGYSINTTDESQVREAGELLREQRPLVLAYDSTHIVSNLVDQRASPVHTWSGEAFIAYWQLFENGDSPIEYHIPTEGGVMWVDAAAIPVTAAHPNAAHAFVDYLLDPRVSATISNYNFYASPNEAALPYIDDWVRQNPSIYPPPDRLEALEYVRDVGAAIETYAAVWEAVTGRTVDDGAELLPARESGGR